MWPLRVVAPDACLGGASDVERRGVLVRVRAGRRVDDRVRPVDDLELVVVPAGPLGPLVGAVADLVGMWCGDRSRSVGRVEVELDHLPVALVLVVEVVERIEDPVLERDSAAHRRIGRDVRVDGRIGPLRDAARPQLVRAAGVERTAGEVEVVLVEAGDVLRGRADLHEVGGVPRAAQRDGRITEEDIDVGRLERLARAALLGLLDEPDDGCVLLGERLLVLQVGAGRTRKNEGRRDDAEDHCRSAAAHRPRSSHRHRPPRRLGPAA